MQINDPIDNPTEAIMNDITTLRYRFPPTAAFATTRAGADRRARQAATAPAPAAGPSGPAAHVLRRLAKLFSGLSS